METPPVPEQELRFRWERRDLLAFAAFFIATVVFLPAIAFMIFRAFKPELRIESLTGVQLIMIQTVMDFLIVGFIFFLVAIMHSQPILRTLHLTQTGNLHFGRWIIRGVALAITVLVISSLLPQPADSPLEKLLTTTPSIVLFAILGIALAPALEEIIFRGFIFSVLDDLYGSKAAVPVTAILFAVLHMSQLLGNWAAIAAILLVGYAFTIVRHRTGSVIPCIIMHTAYNSMIFAAQAIATLLGVGQR
jgi:membrane protease YdiL (CAAX protease family)